ncbi:MAG: DHH family phosphoesterase [Bdellovibrionales bacterium]|nr:DHH family phosphoesterase [Bdellovibrionales bacterium]
MYSKSFLKLLNQKPSPHFVISTHKFCDGDGLGAGLALCYALKKKKQKAEFFTLEKIHPKYEFMDNQNILKVYNPEKMKLPKNSIYIFVDVNDTRLIEPLYSNIKKIQAPVYFIDHHPLVQKNLNDHFFIDITCSSTAELIYSLIKDLQVSLDQDICKNLFSSIVFDTNRFRHIKNSSKPFSIVAELMLQIKDVDYIYDRLFKTLTVNKLRFFSKLEKVEYYSNNRIAFLHLKESELKEYHTDSTQAYDMIDMIRDVEQIDSTILILEKEDGSFKLSLRSRSKDLIPLVKKFKGGGHSHSAGAYISSQSLDKVKKEILSYLK